MLPIRWLGNSRDVVRGWPRVVRQRLGYELWLLQNDRRPVRSKPLKTVGPGVREIRVPLVIQHRVVYVIRDKEAVYVLHAFIKKKQQTPKREIDLARHRLASLK